MKNTLLLIFALASLTLQAQNFSPEVLDTTLYGSPSDATFYGDIDLYNNLGSTINMRWERIEESVPRGWTTSNCDPGQCHPVGVTSANFTLPMGTSYLNTHFNPNGFSGSGYMKVKVWVAANPADSVVLTYYGVAGVLGVDEIQASDIQVFPSPAQHALHIMLPHPGETVGVEVFNLNGQRVKAFEIAQENLTQLDVSQLKAGVYVVRFNLGGKAMVTKKFVKG